MDQQQFDIGKSQFNKQSSFAFLLIPMQCLKQIYRFAKQQAHHQQLGLMVRNISREYRCRKNARAKYDADDANKIKRKIPKYFRVRKIYIVYQQICFVHGPEMNDVGAFSFRQPKPPASGEAQADVHRPHRVRQGAY
jgi:hypothetical protein